MERLSEIGRSAAKFSTQTALVDPTGTRVSYAQLLDRVQRIENHLNAADISLGDRVGILAPKSADVVAAFLATSSLEAAYIPLDAQAPMTRNAYILSDCQVKVVLVADELVEAFVKSVDWTIEQQPLADTSFTLFRCTYSQVSTLVFPEDLAYMLYTSGSTGQPKGVMITHRNALCFVEWGIQQFSVSEKDVLSSIAPFHFDLSVFDLYVSLSSGATLVLLNQKMAKNPLMLAKVLETHRVSVVYATPTLLQLMLNYGKLAKHDHQQLRVVLFAGEVFPLAPLKSLREQWSTAAFYNLYGPTETNVVTWYQVPESIAPDVSSLPIGQACPFTELALWDDEFLPANPGQQGELIASGESVAAGYLNLPEKTSLVFLQIDGKVWYRTGDLVSLNDAGEFVFVGRKDRMVKRRGYRIELAEIERALRAHPQIREAAVVAYANESTGVQLKAFLVKQTDAEEPGFVQLKMHCTQHLPLYMLPDSFTFIDQFPKTSSHKVDYQSLKQLVNG